MSEKGFSRDGVSKIAVPNPYFEQSSNVYLIADEELGLIDTGIDTDETFEVLKKALAHAGFSIKEIKKILITHKHPDHFGMAGRIQSESNAKVYIHQDDWEDVAYFTERRDEVLEKYAQTMLTWGVPKEAVEPVIELLKEGSVIARSVKAQMLADGQAVPLGRQKIVVIHTPGHTQGSVCFRYKDKLFTGDHLLPDYTPNIGATDALMSGMLEKYIQSLLKIRQLDGIEILPGHGEQILNHKALIDSFIQHHQERKCAIVKILSDGSPRSAYQIALELFGDLDSYHVMLGAGEVHAHLEALEKAGQIKKLGNHYMVLKPSAPAAGSACPCA